MKYIQRSRSAEHCTSHNEQLFYTARVEILKHLSVFVSKLLEMQYTVFSTWTTVLIWVPRRHQKLRILLVVFKLNRQSNITLQRSREKHMVTFVLFRINHVPVFFVNTKTCLRAQKNFQRQVDAFNATSKQGTGISKQLGTFQLFATPLIFTGSKCCLLHFRKWNSVRWQIQWK